MQIKYSTLFFICCTLLCSCQSYKQNILFKVDENTAINEELVSENKNRIIDAGDYLQIEVFTGNGEKIIDPDYQLASENVNAEGLRPKLKYLVRSDGNVKLPMVGDVTLIGETLYDAEKILQDRYAEYYKNTFINLRFLNKRVVLLGSPGGKVIPLENENTRLVEIIALAEGIDNYGKGHNIRLLRDEQVFVADFTTIEGFQKGNVIVEPGDVIYIEPIRRPFTEFIRENGPIISIVTSLISLTAVLISVN